MGEHLQVQVGDEVALVSGAGDYQPPRVYRVFSSGEVAFELDDGTRYTAEGFEVGRGRSAWGRVLPMTEVVSAPIQRLEHLAHLHGMDWHTLTNSQLARIMAILSEEPREEGK